MKKFRDTQHISKKKAARYGHARKSGKWADRFDWDAYATEQNDEVSASLDECFKRRECSLYGWRKGCYTDDCLCDDLGYDEETGCDEEEDSNTGYDGNQETEIWAEESFPDGRNYVEEYYDNATIYERTPTSEPHYEMLSYLVSLIYPGNKVTKSGSKSTIVLEDAEAGVSLSD